MEGKAGGRSSACELGKRAGEEGASKCPGAQPDSGCLATKPIQGHQAAAREPSLHPFQSPSPPCPVPTLWSGGGSYICFRECVWTP